MKDDDSLDLMDSEDPIQAEAAAWFSRLRADDASDEDRRQCDAWLAAAPAHRVAYERMQQLWTMLGGFAASAEVDERLASPARPAPVMPAPREFRPTTTPARTSTRRRRHAGWLLASAAALVAIAVGLKMMVPPAIQGQSYASAAGEQRSIVLADGTVVDLDAGSRMRVRYDARQRHIALDQGRAFFQVAKDARRPLSVDTDTGSVRAVGTRFEVDRHARDTSVSLFEGKVQLRRTADDDAVLATLAPGQRALMDGKSVPTLASFTPTDSPAWTRGQLVFEDLPLAAAVEEFNRYAGTPIRIDDPSLAQLRISGVFRSNDTTGFMDALHSAYQIRAQTRDGVTLLSR